MNFFFLLSIFFSLFILSELNKDIPNKVNIKNNINDQIIFKNTLENINSFLENKIKRKLEGENGGGDDINDNNNNNSNKDIKNDNITYINNNKNNQNNGNKSGIGWVGIIIIIILSIVVVYVIFVGFRYYRRKKYQNPSFYYKITEEMFDDILILRNWRPGLISTKVVLVPYFQNQKIPKKKNYLINLYKKSLFLNKK